jgi:hypothetical protein
MSRPFSPTEQDWMDFLDGTLDGARRDSFMAWLAEHPEAAREAEQLVALEADLVLLPLPDVDEERLDQARAAVLAALPTQRESNQHDHPATRLFRLPAWSWLPAAAAALFIGVMLGRGPWGSGGSLMGGGDIDGRVDPLQAVDGGTGSAEGAPLQRKLDVQELDVQRDQSVRILLKETNSYEINGATSDVDVQNTLSYIVRNDRDPARRQTAIQLLEKHCSGGDVCQVLVYAMTQDPVAEVRREAALALQDDQQDEMVRQSYIKMLVEDPSPALRRLAQEVMERQSGTQMVGR